MPTGIYKHKPHSQETKDKLRIANTGKKHSKETIKRMCGMKADKSFRWRGNMVSKRGVHQWVTKYKPKPDVCEGCLKIRKLSLANLKEHNYTRNFEDYRWLCYSCHKIYDNKNICRKGHQLEGSNLLIDNRGERICRECRKRHNKKYREKLKLKNFLEIS